MRSIHSMCGYPDYSIGFLTSKERCRGSGQIDQELTVLLTAAPRAQTHAVRVHSQAAGWHEKGLASLMSLELTSQEALQLAAAFACTADRMRAAGEASEVRQKICETASRIAFLRAHLIASREELFSSPGDALQLAVFAAVT